MRYGNRYRFPIHWTGVVFIETNSNKGKTLYKSEIELRSTMKKRKLMETRKTYRRGRRYRKTRYRHPKFRYHTKRVYVEEPIVRKSTGVVTHWKKVSIGFSSNRPEGWLPPSIESKVNQHINWVNRYLKVLPKGTKLRIEVARFDIAHMRDPSIHGEMYQQGPLYEYENVRAYVFARDGYRCQCCGRKAGTIGTDGKVTKLAAHHIGLKSEGATDRPDELAAVCTGCHTTKAHKPGGILYQWYLDNKRFSRGYRDPTFMSILRKRLFNAFPSAEFTYGNITKADREALGLPKSHANDAVAIAAHGLLSVSDSVGVLHCKQVRKKKRSLHEATPRKGRKEPNRNAKRNEKNTKSSKGFCLYDKVLVNGTTGWISGFSGNGSSVRVIDRNGKYITQHGKEYTTLQLSAVKLLHHNNNWIVFTDVGDSSRV